MATQTTKKKLGRIAFYIGCGFSLILVVCFVVGGPMYISERSKERHYAQELCFVRSASYRSMHRCKLTGGSDRTVRKCYVPIWQVTYGQNGTKKATMEGHGDAANYKSVEAMTERYRVSINSKKYLR
jgi:hypothetical protein